MIQQYDKNGKILYKVRTFARSSINPNLRITKQVGSIESLALAEKEEPRLKKDCDRELLVLEAKGISFGDLLHEWHQHCFKTKVAVGDRSLMTQTDYLAAVTKYLKEYFNRPAGDISSLVLMNLFDVMKKSGLCFGHRKKFKQILNAIFNYGIQSGLLKNMHRSPN